MKLDKAHVIVGFSYLKQAIVIASILTVTHFIYTVSPNHARVIVFLFLTEWVTSISINLIGRDYLNEVYVKLSKEQNNDGQEKTGSTSEGSPE